MNKRSTKRELRSFLAKEIKKIPPEKKNTESSKIVRQLFSLPEWQENNLILAFLSMEQEVQTEAIVIRTLKEGKTLALPRMHGDEIVFHRISSLDPSLFTIHSYGVREPKKTLPVVIPSEENRCLIITPGLGFTANGSRIGRGKGYYDRYFGKYREYLDIVAVAFDCQIVKSIPTETFDETVPVIITPSRLYRPI